MFEKLEKMQNEIWEMQRKHKEGTEEYDVLEAVYQALQDAMDVFEE